MKAHEDKLSAQCLASIVRADFQINSSALIMDYIARQCGGDAKAICPDVDMGDGRVLGCLIGNRASLKPWCMQALQDIGVTR